MLVIGNINMLQGLIYQTYGHFNASLINSKFMGNLIDSTIDTKMQVLKAEQV